VYTCIRASLTDILARKIAPVGQVGEDPRACWAWQAGQGSRRTRRHPRDDPCAEVGEDVRVRVGAVECQLYNSAFTWTHVAGQIAPHASENVARHVVQWKRSH